MTNHTPTIGKNRCISASLLASSLLLPQLAQANAAYQLTDLGTLGGYESWATAINAHGQVTGAAQMENGSFHAFIADTKGPMRDLGALNGGSSYGYDINATGQVTGYSMDSSNKRRAFVTDSQGALTDLGTFGGDNSVGLGINDFGQVTGQVNHISGNANVFVTNPDRSFPCCSSFSAGDDINSSGQVAGFDFSRTPYYYSETNFGYYTHAYIFNADGTQIDLGTLGGTASWATAINDAGQVTGFSYDTNRQTHAFLADAQGQMIDLGTLTPGSGESEGADINMFGQVVGKASISFFSNIIHGQQFGGYSYHAFTTIDGVMQDLNTLVAIGASGWELIAASGINDAGQIVGTGLFNGQRRAYLLTPIASVPIPSAIWIFMSGLGILSLGLRKSRG